MMTSTGYDPQTQREKLTAQAYVEPSLPKQWHFLAPPTDQQMVAPLQ